MLLVNVLLIAFIIILIDIYFINQQYKQFLLSKNNMSKRIEIIESELNRELLALEASELERTDSGNQLLRIISQERSSTTESSRHDIEPVSPPLSVSETRASLRLLSLRISETVPAGGFGLSSFDPEPPGFLEITEVLIKNEPYTVHSIHVGSKDPHVVSITPHSDYHTVQVRGTSMNAAVPIPIDEGDYVLIRPQASVEDNQIVIVGILGHDDRYTIKRLKRHSGKIKLIPESNDHRHYELNWVEEFNEFDDDFRIVGVVEAVFKKKRY